MNNLKSGASLEMRVIYGIFKTKKISLANCDELYLIQLSQ